MCLPLLEFLAAREVGACPQRPRREIDAAFGKKGIAEETAAGAVISRERGDNKKERTTK